MPIIPIQTKEDILAFLTTSVSKCPLPSRQEFTRLLALLTEDTSEKWQYEDPEQQSRGFAEYKEHGWWIELAYKHYRLAFREGGIGYKYEYYSRKGWQSLKYHKKEYR